MSESSSTKPRPAQRSAEEGKGPEQSDPLAGDWSEGLLGPARAHGLPLPVPLDPGSEHGAVEAPHEDAGAPQPQDVARSLAAEPRPAETPWSTPLEDSSGSPGALIPGWSSPSDDQAPADGTVEPFPEEALATAVALPDPPAGGDAWGPPTASAAGPAAPEDWAEPVTGRWSAGAAANEPSWSTGAVSGPELTEEPAAPDWTHAPKPVLAPPPPGASLTEEPPAPDWMRAPRPLLTPLPAGESLSADDPEPGPPPAPAALQVVPPQPEELEDPDLLVPVDDVAFSVPPPRPRKSTMVVLGEHRVAVHTRAGRTRRGTVLDVDLSDGQFALQPQGGGSTETVARKDVKAVFFMLAPGEQAEGGNGPLVRITFEDSRTIEGHLDGEEDANGFFLIPTDAEKTNMRRVYVARAAVSDVSALAQ